MVDFYLQAIYILTGLFSYIASSTATDTIKSTGKHADLIHHLDTVNNQLHALSRSIRSAHSDFTRQQEDVCRYFAPMSDTICGLQSADNSLTRSEALDQAIHGKFSPGKRSEDDFTELSQKRILLDDIMQKQDLLEKLQRIVDAAQSTVQNERKRSCNLNLGFHCQTEQYSAIADMYNWLQSSLSPGKRRRRDTRAKPELRQKLTITK
ncbi:uncharacterized protein LOC123537095 [Mercenaria mercenaria]|uniref:uncharacterized protein LOC123537095 n=1 Tax=Mercenaria mercenaria TaxID=6596 RepID=UPI00234E9D3D|nr:uncharacterized protein LOC123537095 [Mercenaria mercenaria]XP_045176591.2 uncharacterized protein LOC123537095 [Mercenaria mercenaria]